MIDDIRGIEADASGRIADAGSLEALSEVEQDLLGKESQLTGFKRRLGALEPDARREAGAALNATRQAVEALVGARRAELDAAAAAGTIRPVTITEFMVNLISLLVFPVVARPMIRHIVGIGEAEYDQFLDQRAEQVVTFFFAGLRP